MDLQERFRAVNDIADEFGYLGGYPNFNEAVYPHTGRVFGSILVSDQAADWTEIPAQELGDPGAADMPERFRRTHEWAGAHGYASGFPNCHEANHGAGLVYGTMLLSPMICHVQDVPAGDLGNPDPNDLRLRFQRSHDWAVSHGYVGGFPNFHETGNGAGVTYGTVLLHAGGALQHDIPVTALAVQQPFARFRPSVHGFGFTNSWPNAPLLHVDLGIVNIPVGNAAAGLCGGMVFAALDYFKAARARPDPPRPDPGSPLFDYFVERLIDAFDLPHGPLKYLDYMNPARRDHDSHFSRLFGIRGRNHQMLHVEWPKLKDRLDAGSPVPVAWVQVRSANPADLGQNHVVLAYKYDYDGPLVRVWVYNPNVSESAADSQWFAFRGDSTAALDRVTRSAGGKEIVCFFPLAYQQADPP